ncbi:NAD(P)H:quinone oxidoreductase, type IV, partial [Jimgerdemannia flammicorona]
MATQMAKIYIILRPFTRGVAKGLESQGAEVKILRVPETLPAEVLAKMEASPAPFDIAVTNVSVPVETDDILFGSTRFGGVPQQFKGFLNAIGQLWSTGALTGKPCGTFTSTGQETTTFTTITYLAHHGMLYVLLGYVNANHFDGSAITGGDGSRQPSETELSVANTQGGSFAKPVNALIKGKTYVTPLSLYTFLYSPASEPAPIPKAEKKEDLFKRR